MSGQNLGALIDIEQVVALQHFSAPLLDHILNLSHQHVLRHHHADIPGHSREFGDSGVLAVKGGAVSYTHLDVYKRQVQRFQKKLESLGVNATVRRRLGSEISAACGQLRRDEMNGKA